MQCLSPHSCNQLLHLREDAVSKQHRYYRAYYSQLRTVDHTVLATITILLLVLLPATTAMAILLNCHLFQILNAPTSQIQPSAIWPMFHYNSQHTGYQPTGKGRIDQPGLLWNYSTENGVWSSPAIADLNGDSYLEIVVGSDDGCIYCLNATGSLLWKYQTGNRIRSSPAVADLNDDGCLEVVVGSDDDYIYCLNATGNLLWKYQTGSWVRSSPTIIDLDGDGGLEVVVGSDGIYCLNATGDLLWKYQTGVFAVWSSPAVADLDNDGCLEVVVGSDDDYIYCLNATGSLLWCYPTGDRVRSSPTIADLDGDGYLEVVIGSDDGCIYCLNATGSLLWRYSTSDCIWSSPAVADLNDDGCLEVVVGSDDDYIYCLNATGNLLWKYQTGEGASSPAIADINNDSYLEIIAGSEYLYICCLSATGNLLWKYQTRNWVDSSPAIVDVDGDGWLEVVVGGMDSNIYCLDWMDIYPPTITITSPQNQTWYSQSDIWLNLSIRDEEGIRGYTVYLNGSQTLHELLQSPEIQINITYLLQSLQDGWYNTTIVAWDSFDNTIVTEVWFGVDTVPPLVEILDPTNQSQLPYTTKVTVRWWVWDASSGIAIAQLRLVGTLSGYDSGWINVTNLNNYTFTGLTNDTYIIWLNVSDRTGLTNFTHIIFTIKPDVWSPEVQILQPDQQWLNRSKVVIEWRVSDNVSGVDEVWLRLVGVTTGYDSKWLNVTENISYTFADLLDDNYTLYLNASDRVGNLVTVTRWFVVDTQSPRVWITAPERAYLNISSITIEWDYDEQYLDYFLLRLNDEPWINVSTSTSYFFAHLADGNYTISIVAYDKAGNCGEVMTWFIVDTQPPRIVFLSPTNSSWQSTTTISLIWRVVEDYLEKVWLWNSRTWIDVTSRTNYTLTLPGDGRYLFRLKAVDRAGNTETAALVIRIDTQPPQISLVAPLPGFYNTTLLNVSWVVTEANFSHTALYVDGRLYAWLINSSILLRLSEGNHTLGIIVYDRAGNSASVGTWLVIDTTPPSIKVLEPANNTMISENSSRVRWIVEDVLSGVARVRLRLDTGPWIDISNVTEYLLTNLEEGKHVIELRVEDRAGNIASAYIYITVVLPVVTPPPSHFPYTYVAVALLLVGGSITALTLVIVKRRRTPPQR